MVCRLEVVRSGIAPFAYDEEEIGWRGYVLPRLQAKFNALISTLIWARFGDSGTTEIPFRFRCGPFRLVHSAHFRAGSDFYLDLQRHKGKTSVGNALFRPFNTVEMFVPIASTLSNANLGPYVALAVLEVLTGIIIVLTTGSERLSRTEAK